MAQGSIPHAGHWHFARPDAQDWQFARVEEILEFVYISFRRLIPYDRIGLALLDESGTRLRSVWQRADDPALLIAKDYSGAVAETSLGAFLQSGQPRIINDLAAHARARGRSPHSAAMLQRGIRSSLTFPLRGVAGAYGVLFFSSREVHAYREDHLEVLLHLAAEIADLLDPGLSGGSFGQVLATLALQLDRIHHEQSQLRVVAEQLANATRLDDVATVLATTLKPMLPFDFMSLGLLEDDSRVVHVRWAQTPGQDQPLAPPRTAPIAGSGLEDLLQSRQPRIVHDLAAYLTGHALTPAVQRAIDMGIRSNLTCPLIADGRVFGFLYLHSREANRYQESDAALYMRMAPTISRAVARAAELEALEEDHAFADGLLAEMVPEKVLRHLKRSRKIVAEPVADAGVMFVDIVGFTTWSMAGDPRDLVGVLDRLFRDFDGVCHALGVHKLRTIGDAYVVISGVPTPSADHLVRLVKAGLRMVEIAEQHTDLAGKPIAVRVGVASGPLVAGVLGGRVPHYDVWGPTVNLASRIQQAARPQTVHVDPRTADRIRLEIDSAALGPVELRGVGTVEVHSVG